MMRWVRIEDVGDTEFLLDEQMDKFRSLEDNERVIQAGGRPATRSRCCSGSPKRRSRPTRSSRRRASRKRRAR
jgi:DNA-directed RNA polymerase subunit beta'